MLLSIQGFTLFPPHKENSLFLNSLPQKCSNCIPTCPLVSQAMGFFKGMSFPLASITVYNSVVFGFFSNAQRFISKYRYGDGRHPCGMLDLTVASMLTGLMSVGLGAPVDLVKIRLQMQTQTVLAGKSGCFCPFFCVWCFWFLFSSLKGEKRETVFVVSLVNNVSASTVCPGRHRCCFNVSLEARIMVRCTG